MPLAELEPSNSAVSEYSYVIVLSLNLGHDLSKIEMRKFMNRI